MRGAHKIIRPRVGKTVAIVIDDHLLDAQESVGDYGATLDRPTDKFRGHEGEEGEGPCPAPRRASEHGSAAR